MKGYDVGYTMQNEQFLYKIHRKFLLLFLQCMFQIKVRKYYFALNSLSGGKDEF